MISHERVKLFARIGISTIVLVTAIYIILSQQFADDYAKWAFGTVGVIIGYWLR